MALVRIALTVTLALLVSAGTDAARAALPVAVGETPVPSLSPMIKRVSPAVVNISTRGTLRQPGRQTPLFDDPFFRRFFDAPPNLGPREREFQSAGSGVIFDAGKGYIVTNAHVVEHATEITVTLQDGRELKAEVVGRDPPSDVAVLKVKPGNLTEVALGDSTHIEVGDFVVAIGNPFGLRHTVTSGIVSGLNRAPRISADQYEDFIQTDASINPGNSGGALVNLNGELIGINTAIFSASGGNIGIGFAIPVNMARTVMDQLIRFGAVKRGLLGVTIQEVTSDIAQSLGLDATQGGIVTQVVEGSAADKAGVRPGDVVTSVNGQPVRSQSELRQAMGPMHVGDKVKIGLLRDGNARQVTAVIAETAAPAAAATSADVGAIHRGFAGVSLVDMPEAGGVRVRSVEDGSAGQQAGFRENDVIIAVNRLRVRNVEHLRELSKGATMLVLNVRRGRTALLIPLKG
jgi:Do/DeqQ family serine protease